MKGKYSEEFKSEAVRLVVEQGLSVAQASRDLGVSPTALDNWVRARRAEGKPEALTESEREELKRLRKEK